MTTRQNPDPPGEINMSHIPVSGGAAGLLFAAGTVYIFFVGLPMVRWFLAAAVVAGVVVSIILYLFHKRRPTHVDAILLHDVEKPQR